MNKESDKPMIMRTILASLLVVVFATGSAQANNGWTKLGERKVSDKVEKDTISFKGDRSFRKVKFCVKKNPVNFVDIDIHFENGGRQDVDIAKNIKPGKCTRVITLNGGKRDLKKIVMRYEENSPKKAKAVVVVMGK